MDIDKITEWLRTSIPGIIILGAFGSLLAIVLLSPFRFLLKKLPPFRILHTYIPFYKRGFFDGALFHTVKAEKDVQRLVVYLIYRSVRCLIGVLFAIFFGSFVIFTFVQENMIRLNLRLFIFVVLSILSLLFAFLDFLTISTAKEDFIGPLFKQTDGSLREYRQKLSSSEPKGDKDT